MIDHDHRRRATPVDAVLYTDRSPGDQAFRATRSRGRELEMTGVAIRHSALHHMPTFDAYTDVTA